MLSKASESNRARYGYNGTFLMTKCVVSVKHVFHVVQRLGDKWRLTMMKVVYRHGRITIFRMPIYPMLNRWNANPMTPNPGL